MSTGTEELDGVAGWAVDLMEDFGAPGAGLAIAAENLFPPLPSEVILPLAGFTASRGTFGLIEVLVWTTLGSVVGAVALYLVGRALGRDRMLALATRLPLVEPADVERAEAWFHRHGQKAVFYGRMVPLVRSFISVPAGTQAMPLGRFVVLTTLGSALWNTVFVLAGYELGEQWHRVEAYAGALQLAVVAAALAGVAWWLARALRRRAA